MGLVAGVCGAPTASVPVSACAVAGLPTLPCNLWPQFPRLHTEGRDSALRRGLRALALPRAQPRSASCSRPGGRGSPSLARGSPRGRYLVRGPRLLVGPVPVAPHVPPLDLQRVGGGAAAAEGAGHLHVLARPCRHVVGRLCEQGCAEKVGEEWPGLRRQQRRWGGQWEWPGFRRGPWRSSSRPGPGVWLSLRQDTDHPTPGGSPSQSPWGQGTPTQVRDQRRAR